MGAQKSQFNRILLTIFVILYVLTIIWFSYANWNAAPAGFYQWWMVLLNILIISIPIISMYGSLYILAIAWREHSVGQVSARLAKIIHWSPRVVTIIIIFFITLFSLDVFEMDASLLELLGGFLLHNIPSIVLLILLLIAWKRPEVGFVGFLVAAVLITMLFVRDIFALSNVILFVLPILLIACLFYADWKWQKTSAFV
jgi:hypothetical protein